MSRWMTLYYTIPMFVFLAITIFVTMLREQIGTSSNALPAESAFWLLIGISIIQAYISIWVHRRKSKINAYNMAERFGHDEFTAMFAGTQETVELFDMVIKRHKSIMGRGKNNENENGN